jgi:hypothetical protein
MSTSDMQSRSSRPCGFESGYHFHGVNKRVVVKRNADVKSTEDKQHGPCFLSIGNIPRDFQGFSHN